MKDWIVGLAVITYKNFMTTVELKDSVNWGRYYKRITTRQIMLVMFLSEVGLKNKLILSSFINSQFGIKVRVS